MATGSFSLIKCVTGLAKHLLVFVFVVLPLILIGIPVLAIVLLFVKRDAVRLPSAFKWWDNHDSYGKPEKNPPDGLSGNPTKNDWWSRFYWLALRNPLNYFQYRKLGFQHPIPVAHQYYNNGIAYPDGVVQDLFMHKRYKINGKDYFEIFYIKTFGSSRYLRLRIGWKIEQFNYMSPDRQWVFSLTPFRKR